MADEDDVATTAFQNFFQAVEDGRFTQLENRDDMWQVLLMLVSRAVSRQKKHQRTAKRGGDKLRGESAFEGATEKANVVSGFDLLASRPSVVVSSMMT